MLNFIYIKFLHLSLILAYCILHFNLIYYNIYDNLLIIINTGLFVKK